MSAAGRSGVDLHLDLAPGPGGTGRALERALRDAIRDGRLPAGARLPGTRTLAADLGLARGTVVQAYAQLTAEGWLTTAPGSATRIAPTTPPTPIHPPARCDPSGPGSVGCRSGPEVAVRVDLRPGRPDLSLFPRAAWASSVRRVLGVVSNPALDYPEWAGVRELRVALAGYLSRTRGVHTDPDSVVVTAGFTHGLALLARAGHALGIRAAATEDPGLARHRALLHAAGLAVVPLPVDARGADPGALDPTDPPQPALASTHAPRRVRLVLVTPAHQHPYGVVLAPERRSGLVAWARAADGYVVEDDYDGEFRYDQQPVGAMQPLDPDRVVYAGSASKALAPGLRLGWLVLPPALRAPVLAAIEATGAQPAVLDQLALADLIDRGGYDRHIRRARLTYRHRRTDLAARLTEAAGPTGAGGLAGTSGLTGVAAGLHAVLPVESAGREAALVEAGRRRGIRLHGLHSFEYWHRPGPDRPAALVLGYATPPAHAWQLALDELTALLAT